MRATSQKTPVPPLPLLTTKQVMAILAVGSRSTVWKLEKAGHLIPIRVGRSVRYRPEDVQAFILTGGAARAETTKAGSN